MLLVTSSATSIECSRGDIDCWVHYSNNYVYAEGNTVVPTISNGNVTKLNSVALSHNSYRQPTPQAIQFPTFPSIPNIPYISRQY